MLLKNKIPVILLSALTITFGQFLPTFPGITGAIADSPVGTLEVKRAGDNVTLEWEVDETFDEITISRDGALIYTNLKNAGKLSQLVPANENPQYELTATGPISLQSSANSSERADLSNHHAYESLAVIGLGTPGENGVTESVAAATPAATSTTLRYLTFIPEAFVAAPPVGCTYSGDFDYYFKGDSRTYSVSSQAYRTKFDVLINWGNQSVTSYRSVGSTKVYQKSGAQFTLRDTSTASNSSMKLTPTAASTVQAKFNMRQDVANPFCSSNGIYFDFDVTINRSGNYDMVGERLQVPTHEIYVKDSDVAAWKTVLRDPALNFSACLTPGLSTAIGCLESTTVSGSRG